MSMEVTKNINATKINIIDLNAPKEGTGDSSRKIEKHNFFWNMCPRLAGVVFRIYTIFRNGLK
jgi:hypothetical protein